MSIFSKFLVEKPSEQQDKQSNVLQSSQSVVHGVLVVGRNVYDVLSHVCHMFEDLWHIAGYLHQVVGALWWFGGYPLRVEMGDVRVEMGHVFSVAKEILTNLWQVICHLCSVGSHMWQVARGIYQVACSIWQVASDALTLGGCIARVTCHALRLVGCRLKNILQYFSFSRNEMKRASTATLLQARNMTDSCSSHDSPDDEWEFVNVSTPETNVNPPRSFWRFFNRA